MSEFVLHGAEYSVYTRIPRLVIEEAGAPYRFETVDIFAEGGPPPGYLERHPFGKIPALEHDGFRLFETDAIVGYIVDVTGAGLLPADTRARARMRQIMRIVDNYAYPVLMWDIYVHEHLHGTPASADVQEKAANILRVLDEFMSAPYLTGEAFSLADCWLVPTIDYLKFCERGRALLAAHPRITAWWSRMETRPSVAATAFVDERES